MISLGAKVKDTISQFIGIATGRTEYLNGCISVLVEGEMHNNKRVSEWFDEQRLDLLERDAFQRSVESAAQAGGPVYGEPPRDPWESS